MAGNNSPRLFLRDNGRYFLRTFFFEVEPDEREGALMLPGREVELRMTERVGMFRLVDVVGFFTVEEVLPIRL